MPIKHSAIVIAVITLTGLGIAFVLGYQALYNSRNSVETVVAMKENHFEPDMIQIRRGDRVTFKNEDSRPWWPASNLHPTHGIYPEFDPLQPVDPGRAWTFIFDKPGTWRYHDHLAPSILGTVEVVQ